MKSQCRTALLAGCVLVVALPGLSRDAQAAPIDNDVVMEWQQKAYANFCRQSPTEASTSTAWPIGCHLDWDPRNRSDLLGGYDLTLDVVNPFTSVPGDYTPILLTVRRSS